MNLVEYEGLNIRSVFKHFSRLSRRKGVLDWQNVALSHSPVRMFDMAESMVNDGSGKILRLNDLSGNEEHLTDTNGTAALRAIIADGRLQTTKSGPNSFYSNSTSTNIDYAHVFAVVEFDANSFQDASMSCIIGSGNQFQPSQIAYDKPTTEIRFYNASGTLVYTETATFPTGKGVLEWSNQAGGMKWNGQNLFPSEAGSSNAKHVGLLIGSAYNKASGFTAMYCDAIVAYTRGFVNELFDDDAATEVRVALANYYGITLP